MTTFSNLTKENVAYYAAVHYDNPKFTRMEQFNRDLRKVSIIKKYMNKFDTSDNIDFEGYRQLVRKITNNIITFLNLFGDYAGMRIVFVLMEERFLGKIKPIVELLYNETPLSIDGINNQDVILEHIETDEFFASFVNGMIEYQGMKQYG